MGIILYKLTYPHLPCGGNEFIDIELLIRAVILPPVLRSQSS